VALGFRNALRAGAAAALLAVVPAAGQGSIKLAYNDAISSGGAGEVGVPSPAPPPDTLKLGAGVAPDIHYFNPHPAPNKSPGLPPHINLPAPAPQTKPAPPPPAPTGFPAYTGPPNMQPFPLNCSQLRGLCCNRAGTCWVGDSPTITCSASTPGICCTVGGCWGKYTPPPPLPPRPQSPDCQAYINWLNQPPSQKCPPGEGYPCDYPGGTPPRCP